MRAAKYKICRTLGCNIWGREKDPYNFKNYFPGQHGQTVVRNLSPYALQLRAKQKLRFYYNVSEKQFSNLFKKANSKKGNTADNLVNLLERRLDAFVYRCNFAPTIFAARQIVNHGHVLVNGRKVDIKSYTLKDGDVVSLTDKAKNIGICKAAIDTASRDLPDYIKGNENGSAAFIRSPSITEIPYECIMEVNLVIEYYSH